MNIIVLIAIVIVVLAIAIYAIREVPIIEQPWKSILIVLACLAAIVVILANSGLGMGGGLHIGR